MKRHGFVSLCLALALIVASCGQGSASQDTQKSGGNDSTALTVEEAGSGVPDDVDLGGETITLLNSPQYEAFLSLNHVEEETGDTINDAVYRRNLNVMEKLNCQLAFVDEWDNDVTYIRTQVASGDNPFDFIIGTEHLVIQLTTENLFLDLMDAPYIDISEPWWAESYINTINMGNKKRFFVSGDLSLEFLRDLGCGFYNKSLYEDYYGDGDGLFSIIADGKWTLDKLSEMVRDSYRDLNGNNERDEDDQYGFRQIPYIFSEHAFYAAGGQCCVIGSDGYPELSPVSEKSLSIAEKISALYHNNEGSYIYKKCTTTETEQIMPEKFASNQSLFYWGLLYYSDYLREMESDYGVIPYPKYEESDEYRSMVHDGASIICIPVTASEKFDSVCAVIEEMAYQGHKLCTPAYFDVVLKGKYMREGGQSSEILDMIRESAYTEVGMIYNFALNSAGLMIREVAMNDKNLTTVWAGLQSGAEKKLEKLIETYEAIE